MSWEAQSAVFFIAVLFGVSLIKVAQYSFHMALIRDHVLIDTPVHTKTYNEIVEPLYTIILFKETVSVDVLSGH